MYVQFSLCDILLSHDHQIVVSQLADLFWQLEYLQTASVTPTIELAKLALVTSRDEEEDEVGTDSSNDTDATLVEDAPARIPTSEPSRHSSLRSPNSVLGKRPRRRSEMDVDSPVVDSARDKDAFVIVSNPTSPLRSNTPPAEGSSSKPRDAPQPEGIVDVDMQDGSGPVSRKTPPSLPPRKIAATSDSSMMFGKYVLLLQWS
jgi:ubiquitin carboxyl-terminal hydrolase 25/28